jgi:release factor glutamine methyltransferase
VSAAANDSPRTVLEFLQVTTAFLTGRGIDGARLDAELLLAEALCMTRTQLYTNFERPLGAAEIDRYRELVRRRAAREPVAYITGRREFWSMEFAVDRRVLIPRPETELLVELAVEELKARAGGSGGGRLKVADIGTGSGAIAIAIAKEIEKADVIATDLSQAALEVAPVNAERHGVAARIQFRAGNLCEPLAGDGPFDVIVSNPPYLRRREMADIAPEVREWEPRRALDSGRDGMDATAPLVDAAYGLLAPGASLWVEVGTQADSVRDAFVARGYDAVRTRLDLAGIIRAVGGRRSA